MDYAKLKVEIRDGVAIVTLSDPATLNAAGLDMGAELTDVFKRVSHGLLEAGRELDVDGRPDAGRALETVYNPLVSLIRDLPVPLVTAVNGAAAGVGCSFALMGDIVVAAESAYFLQAFRRIGLVPDGGSTYLLPRLVGKARAMEMALLGEKIPAARALDWGLINRCVPDAELMPTALALAAELAAGPRSLGLIRRAIWDSLDAGWTEQLQAERAAQKLAGKTDDFIEGVGAFLQKRPAAFKGR